MDGGGDGGRRRRGPGPADVAEAREDRAERAASRSPTVCTCPGNAGERDVKAVARDDLGLRIQVLIERGAAPAGQNPVAQNAEFDALALELFAYQFEHNAP